MIVRFILNYTKRDIIGCGRSYEEMKVVFGSFLWIEFNIWKGWLPEGENREA